MEQPIIFPPLIGHCTHNVTAPLKAQVAFNRRFHNNRALFSPGNCDKLGTKPEDQSRARLTTVPPFWGEFFNTTKGSFALFARESLLAHTHTPFAQYPESCPYIFHLDRSKREHWFGNDRASKRLRPKETSGVEFCRILRDAVQNPVSVKAYF